MKLVIYCTAYFPICETLFSRCSAACPLQPRFPRLPPSLARSLQLNPLHFDPPTSTESPRPQLRNRSRTITTTRHPELCHLYAPNNLTCVVDSPLLPLPLTCSYYLLPTMGWIDHCLTASSVLRRCSYSQGLLKTCIVRRIASHGDGARMVMS